MAKLGQLGRTARRARTARTVGATSLLRLRWLLVCRQWWCLLCMWAWKARVATAAACGAEEWVGGVARLGRERAV